MLNPEDRRAIEGLFDRLSQAEQQAPDRDREAEDLIRAEIDRQPHAPYYMAQTIVVQQQALEMADQRIRELEQQVAERSRPRSPWDRGEEQADQRQQQRGMGGGFGGGGFLAGAAQTALGVAGGVLLGSAIGSLFGAGGAHAAEPAPAEPEPEAAETDAGQDDGGGDWGDLGGGGDFDMGGDF